MKKLKKLDFDSPELGSYTERQLQSLSIKTINDLVDAVEELQEFHVFNKWSEQMQEKYNNLHCDHDWELVYSYDTNAFLAKNPKSIRMLLDHCRKCDLMEPHKCNKSGECSCEESSPVYAKNAQTGCDHPAIKYAGDRSQVSGGECIKCGKSVKFKDETLSEIIQPKECDHERIDRGGTCIKCFKQIPLETCYSIAEIKQKWNIWRKVLCFPEELHGDKFINWLEKEEK